MFISLLTQNVIVGYSHQKIVLLRPCSHTGIKKKIMVLFFYFNFFFLFNILFNFVLLLKNIIYFRYMVPLSYF